MTQAKRHIHVNAFNMNCVGHIHHGLWTHPRDRSTEYGTLAYWTHIARVLEEGLFDGIFIADVVGYYDVYQGGVDLTLREGIQLPVNNRSEEHTSELQSQSNLVCRLLLEKKKKNTKVQHQPSTYKQ